MPIKSHSFGHQGAISAAILASGFLLVIGQVAPAIRIESTSQVSELVDAFYGHGPQDRTLSIIGGVVHLFRDGNIFIASVVFLFSVAFPVAKLIGYWMWAHQDQCQRIAEDSGAASRGCFSDWPTTVEKLGKWSMLDVFVMALLVLVFQTFNGFEIEFAWGFYCFTIALLISLFVGVAIRQRTMRT